MEGFLAQTTCNFLLSNTNIKNRATIRSAQSFSKFIDTKFMYLPVILVEIYVPKNPHFFHFFPDPLPAQTIAC